MKTENQMLLDSLIESGWTRSSEPGAYRHPTKPEWYASYNLLTEELLLSPRFAERIKETHRTSGVAASPTSRTQR